MYDSRLRLYAMATTSRGFQCLVGCGTDGHQIDGGPLEPAKLPRQLVMAGAPAKCHLQLPNIWLVQNYSALGS